MTVESPPAALLRLNVGAGPIRHPGEIGVDAYPTEACDVQGDLLAGLPFPDGSCEFVRLDHILEHQPYRSAPRALFEVLRVLAPGGTVRIGVPDLEATCRTYVEATDLMERAYTLRQLFGSQAHDGEFHMAGWDPLTLRDLMESCGFVDVRVEPDPERDEGICLQAFGVKP